MSLKLIKYLLPVLVIPLISWTHPGILDTKKPNVIGKWYHSNGANYYKDGDNNTTGRWYQFKANSQVTFSSCTDWCGCMRVTYVGKYKWENDSIISITYTKKKREHEGGFNSLKENRTEKLQITKITKGLKISTYRE